MTVTRTRLPKATLDGVGLRARGYCERCRRFLRGLYSHHHRIPRGMGGSRDVLLSHPSNIVLLCGSGTTGCHGWIERNRADAYALGWLVDRYTAGEPTDPRLVPIYRDDNPGFMIPGPGRWFALVERVAAYDVDSA